MRNPDATDWGADWLQRDYQIAQGLSANCAVKPLAVEQTDWGPALIYADAGARPLEALVAEGPLDIETALNLGVSLAEAIAALHKERLIHCNLNPMTVWVKDASGDALISDFGCARHLSKDTAQRQPHCDHLFDVRYIAPEQTGRLQNAVDQRTDIYALGIILYRLLTGNVPFDGTDPVHIIDGHVARPPAFPS